MNETNGNLRDRVSRIEGGYEHLATKADIAETKAQLANVKSELKADVENVRAELKADVENVRAELANVKAELKADVAEVKADLAQFKTAIDERIARLETRLLLRMSGLVVAAVAAAVGFSQLVS